MALTITATYVPAGLGNALYKDKLPGLPSGKTTWGNCVITTPDTVITHTSGTFVRTFEASGGLALEFELVNSGTGITYVVSAKNCENWSIATS